MSKKFWIINIGEFNMWLDNASDIDMLFYKPYADLISKTACDECNSPLTIGLFGLWGAGKSTLLQLIENELNTKDDMVVVNINAWMFEGYDDAKSALMESLLHELNENQKLSADFKKGIKGLFKRINLLKLARFALPLAGGILGSVITGNPLPALSTVPGAIKEGTDLVGNMLQEGIKEPGSTTVENIRQFRREFETLISTSDKKTFVILIDDLDRCTPDRIIETLEAIKLFLSVKGTVFVIAADEFVIQYAIKQKYPPNTELSVDISNEYIEKIIQLPILVPDLSTKDLENYLILLVAQQFLKAESFKELINTIHQHKWHTRSEHITGTELMLLISEISTPYKQADSEQELKNVLEIVDNIRGIVAFTLKGNPRQAKRFLNTFITKKTLAEMYFPGELDMKILAKLLVLNKISPALFRQLNDWNVGFSGSIKELEEAATLTEDKDTDQKYKAWREPRIKKWLDCPPNNIHEIRLDKYFYLTREELKRSSVQSILNDSAKTILEKLAHSTPGTVSMIIDELKNSDTETISQVIRTYIKQIPEDKCPWPVIRGFFDNFPDYRNELLIKLKLINLSPLEAEANLLAMSKIDKPLILAFILESKFTPQVKSTITKKIEG